MIKLRKYNLEKKKKIANIYRLSPLLVSSLFLLIERAICLRPS